MTEPINEFSGEYGFLSNFFSSPFVVKNTSFPTIEHAYQAFKAKEHKDFERIKNASTPAQAKKMGKRIKRKDNFEVTKIFLMNRLVYEKFTQNLALKNELLNTGKTILIEGNCWHDNLWGDCFCDKCKNKQGLNCLGNILMTVRSLLQPE